MGWIIWFIFWGWAAVCNLSMTPARFGDAFTLFLFGITPYLIYLRFFKDDNPGSSYSSPSDEHIFKITNKEGETIGYIDRNDD